MTEQGRPKKHPDSAFRSIGEEGGLVVLPGKAEVKVLNPVGIKIFSMLDGNHSEDEIVSAVLEEFDSTEAQIRNDLKAFLGDLQANGMLAQAEEEANHE